MLKVGILVALLASSMVVEPVYCFPEEGQSEPACLLQSAFASSDISVSGANMVEAADSAPVSLMLEEDESAMKEVMLRSQARSRTCKAHFAYLNRKVNGLEHARNVSDKKIDEIVKGFISKQSGSQDACSSQLLEAKHQLNQIHDYVMDLVMQVNSTEKAILALDKQMQDKIKEMEVLDKWKEDEIDKCEKKKQEYIEMYKKLSDEMKEMKEIASPGVAMDVKTGKIITAEAAVGLIQKHSDPSANYIMNFLSSAKDRMGEVKDMKGLDVLIKGTQAAAKQFLSCMSHTSGPERLSQLQQSQKPKCALRADTYNSQQIPANCRSKNFPVGSKFCVAGRTYTVLKSWDSSGGSSVNHARVPGRETIKKGTEITFGSCGQEETEPETGGDDPEPYNCRTREKWSSEKTTWCCKNKGLGCPKPTTPARPKPTNTKCALRADTYNSQQIPANCRSKNFPVGSKFCVAGRTYTVLKSWDSSGGSSVNHARVPGRETIKKGTEITFGSCKPETGGPDPEPGTEENPKPEPEPVLDDDDDDDAEGEEKGKGKGKGKKGKGKGKKGKGNPETEPETGGDDPEPYNCRTRELWSSEKTAWCCKNKGLGCPKPQVKPISIPPRPKPKLPTEKTVDDFGDEGPDMGDLSDGSAVEGSGGDLSGGADGSGDGYSIEADGSFSRDKDDQAAIDAAEAIKNGAATPENCAAEKDALEETYLKTYVELSRLKDEYNDLANSTACFDNVESIYKSRKTPLQEAVDNLIKDIDVKVRELQGLRPRLESATIAEKKLRKHIATLTQECAQLPETISNLDKVRDAIEALSKCPGLSRVQFSLPKWTGTWVTVHLKAKKMTDEEQDKALDAACAAAAQGSRAAEVGEIAEQTVEGIPETNTAELPLVGTCPNCAGDEAADFPSGHKRVCFRPGKELTPSGKSTNCASGKKAVLCVTDRENVRQIPGES